MSQTAIASKGLVNLRSEPRQQSELLSQYRLGGKFEILGKEGNYYQVETDDEIKGWVHQSGIIINDALTPDDDIFSDRLMICVSHFSILREKESSDSLPVSLVFLGTILNLDEPVTNYYLKTREWLRVKLPDNTVAFMKKDDFNVLANYQERYYYNPKTAIDAARSLIGVSYLWGGTTPAAIDCSGMVQLCCGMAGKNLPRNSYQQAEIGELIEADSDFLSLQPGDLLFFSEGEKVSHVGMSLGQSRFIHSCLTYGQVVITSLKKGDVEYHQLFRDIYSFSKRLDWSLRDQTE
jgi:hypothetical protein